MQPTSEFPTGACRRSAWGSSRALLDRAVAPAVTDTGEHRGQRLDLRSIGESGEGSEDPMRLEFYLTAGWLSLFAEWIEGRQLAACQNDGVTAEPRPAPCTQWLRHRLTLVSWIGRLVMANEALRRAR